jgi:hypothetical protein
VGRYRPPTSWAEALARGLPRPDPNRPDSRAVPLPSSTDKGRVPIGFGHGSNDSNQRRRRTFRALSGHSFFVKKNSLSRSPYARDTVGLRTWIPPIWILLQREVSTNRLSFLRHYKNNIQPVHKSRHTWNENAYEHAFSLQFCTYRTFSYQLLDKNRTTKYWWYINTLLRCGNFKGDTSILLYNLNVKI